MISDTDGSSRKVVTGERNFLSVTSKMASLFMRPPENAFTRELERGGVELAYCSLGK
jgi:hypothetical protein